MRSFGERIKAERIRLGLNREEAAAAGDVHINMQGRYERDEAMPNSVYLVLMADQGMDVQYVLTGTRASAIPINKVLLAALLKRVIQEARIHPHWNIQGEQVIPAMYERIMLNLKPESDIQLMVDQEVDYLMSVLSDTLPEEPPSDGKNISVTGDSNRVAGRDYTENKHKRRK